jgi:exopolyphosphatase/guanosine-5'-triphosphate,3'-diphosphate pyrophosphatase
MVAQIDETGIVYPLDTLKQPVQLGKDTFTKGRIGQNTLEECVNALRSFRRILDEYQISDSSRIRAVATSAVRETANQQAFLDRIYMATGIPVEAIDEAEVTRLTYLAVRPHLEEPAIEPGSKSLIVEVGGGSTELLLVEGRDVVFSHSFRLGSLRMRQMLEEFRAPAVNFRDMLENHLSRAIQQINVAFPLEGVVNMISMGGDMRFATTELVPGWNQDRLAKISASALSRFADELLSLSVEDIVRKYHLNFPDAETLGPSLLTYARLAEAFKLKNLFVTNATLRDGLLKEMATGGAWTDQFKDQVVRAAIDLGRKFHFDEDHARQVAGLCRQLFEALREEHQLSPQHELILYIAALLHEIGLIVSDRSHHKHSMYLIMNSELFGLSERDMTLVALVARYHRRASPKPNHPFYATLTRDERIAMAKMAAMLRVADALDRAHRKRINRVSCRREDGTLVITIPGIDDLGVEQIGMRDKGSMFEEVYGMKVVLRKGRAS